MPDQYSRDGPGHRSCGSTSPEGMNVEELALLLLSCVVLSKRQAPPPFDTLILCGVMNKGVITHPSSPAAEERASPGVMRGELAMSLIGYNTQDS